ncbi:GNAT family N-acetyltransferase [Agrobacterium sp. Azo12]|jgi:RimJ/RimL family protein N-acetyltransferase|uniref:GNAT family N-acetyltransferase n=1 Tax=Agrobacterium sp. Azo12 TaxID=3031129 RepID=UPI0023D87EA2|nr:GNAT family N-acetyltransferase [Agrobacterium sp. Azo12]MDO5898480.1 GNAT family N-acetyltransferase [Agrobacterium sp. Azo12]
MIETDRLLLRPYVLAECQSYLAMCSDPLVLKFLGGKPFSPEDAWHRILRYTGHWALLNYGIFAVIERSSGEYIGETGIADFHRGLGDAFDGYGEASWTFASRVHGRGFALEAAEAAHKWYNANLHQNRTVCLIDPDNAASLKMAGRLGYTAFDTRDYKGQTMVVLERTASA